MKKQAIVALLAMLTISILPGCGKSKNDGQPVAVGPAPVYPGGVGPIAGGCYNLQGNLGGATLFFAGQGVVNSGVEAQMQASSGSLPGVNYGRTNMFGDQLQMYVSGNTAYGLATLTPGAVSVINYYFGGQVCGLYVNSSVSGSNLNISATFLGAGGQPIPKAYVSL